MKRAAVGRGLELVPARAENRRVPIEPMPARPVRTFPAGVLVGCVLGALLLVGSYHAAQYVKQTFFGGRK